jgi:multidrug efflux pump subunit AcrA (membrane-fusion protein)
MMRPTRSLLAAASSVVLSLAVWACSNRAPMTASGDEPAIPVTIAKVTMADVADTFEAGGVVQARTTATIMARIQAPVREVRVAPGDRVRAGQVLIVLDGGDLAAQARSAQAAALAASHGVIAAASEQEAAEAALTLARAMHARIAGLHAKRSATAQELDAAISALQAAEARAAGAAARAQAAQSTVESARAASEAAGATESFARITAPFDGIVAEKLVEPGNMAAPGTPLIRLEDTRGFRLDVRVDQSRIDQIAVDAAVAVSLDSGTGGVTTTVNGTVAEIGRAVEADARAFLVKITLPHAAGLRSGLFGRARFGGPPRRALTVPAAALARHGQVTSVFVVEEGIARLRLVNVAGTEVLAGLSDGDVVIVAAPPAVIDGRRVTEGGRR